MELSGMAIGRRSEERLEELLAAAQSAPLTYDHVGSTLRDGVPPGIRDAAFAREVDGTIGAAATALHGWAAHRGIRGRVLPAGAPLEVGQSIVVVAPFGPVEMAVPTRVVAVVDEADRFGFAYGTLPGHVEAGEELFLATRASSGRVVLHVRIHARPATLLTRLGGPVVTLVQRIAARRYIAAWAAAMGEEI
jgi:uncharacterized protein (UPF0548 family)